MLKKSVVVVVLIFIGLLGPLVIVRSIAMGQKASVPKPHDDLAIGEGAVRKLLLLMDTDSGGKVSKQEFMRFMEAEFDRLDKKKEGKLDVKELTQQLATRGFRK